MSVISSTPVWKWTTKFTLTWNPCYCTYIHNGGGLLLEGLQLPEEMLPHDKFLTIPYVMFGTDYYHITMHVPQSITVWGWQMVLHHIDTLAHISPTRYCDIGKEWMLNEFLQPWLFLVAKPQVALVSRAHFILLPCQHLCCCNLSQKHWVYSGM